VKISHHLDDATVVAYAAGTLGHAHGMVVASHLAFCAECRASVREAEVIGGEIMELEGQSAAVSDMCRAATMASLDAAVPAAARAKPAKAFSDMPEVLSRALGGQKIDDLKWKKKAPGVSVFEVPMPENARGKLMLLSIGPGKSMPEHSHGGEELTLILRGSYSDKFGRFTTGDVADLDEEAEHQPVVDSSEPCICLVAIEAPTKFKSFWAKIAQPFVGI
jgi:putative transcriptional regulator